MHSSVGIHTGWKKIYETTPADEVRHILAGEWLYEIRMTCKSTQFSYFVWLRLLRTVGMSNNRYVIVKSSESGAITVSSECCSYNIRIGIEVQWCIHRWKREAKTEITLTMIMSKLLARWSGSVRFETSSSDKPLNRSCFFRSLVGICLTAPFKICLEENSVH